MCEVLQVSRSRFYYKAKEKDDDLKVTVEIIEIFKSSRNNYGTRKIKIELAKKGYQVSRRRIGRLMKQEGLVSNYTVAQYKPHKNKCNESKTANIVQRKFSDRSPMDVIVSDLTYVRVGYMELYLCAG